MAEEVDIQMNVVEETHAIAITEAEVEGVEDLPEDFLIPALESVSPFHRDHRGLTIQVNFLPLCRRLLTSSL